MFLYCSVNFMSDVQGGLVELGDFKWNIWPFKWLLLCFKLREEGQSSMGL